MIQNNFKILDPLGAYKRYTYSLDRVKNTPITLSFNSNELLNEEWKCISSIPIEYKSFLKNKYLLLYEANSYYISNLGRVSRIYENLENTLILLPALTDNKGYKRICLNDIDDYNYFLIHRLVGFLFIPIVNVNYRIINHKDENVINNRSSNLEWCDNQYNSNYGTILKRVSKANSKSKTVKNNTRKVICTFNNEEKEIDSLKEAALFLNININKVYEMCRTNKEFKGYRIRYADNLPSKSINCIKSNEPIVKLDYFYDFKELYLCTSDIETNSNRRGLHLIYNSCNNHGKTMRNGYRWMHLKDYNELLIKDNKEPIIVKISVVLLTERKRFKKLYLDPYDIANDGYNISSVIEYCRKPFPKKCKDRCWMFLEDYLRIGKISSLDEIDKVDLIALNQSIVVNRKINILKYKK